MTIFEKFPQHQYFITTHSPAIIAASKTCNIIQLEYDEKEYKTNISVIDSQNMQSMYSLLSKIGVKLSDVFGADYILWVEGATEELCFPLIVENILDKSLLGTQIIGVQHTSDFEGKLSRTVFEIYERLSTGKGLLPPAIGFIFDRENRTQQNINDLQRQSKGIVKFLSRVMYENYLLNLDAIIHVISESDSSIEKEITLQDIERWFKDNGNHRNYFSKGETPIDFENPQWIEKVHGANILKGVFNDLSETRVAYDKVIHGELLTKWIIENSPFDLSEVSGLIDSILALGR